MAVQLDRALSNGTTSASGTYARAVVLVDISSILNAVGLSAAEKRGQAKQALWDEFNRGLANDGRTDAEIDAAATVTTTQATADATRIKAAKPTGTL